LPEFYEKLDKVIQKIDNSKLTVKKLEDLKKLMAKYKEELFTCITHEHVEPTNNKAERKQRPLSLKENYPLELKLTKGMKPFPPMLPFFTPSGTKTDLISLRSLVK